MVDSHVLVGSCAQIGARVHLAAGVTIGGVLEPPGARPVIVEDDAFVGAGSALLEGVLVGRGAVIAAGVTLTGTSRLYDLVRGRVLEGTAEAPLVVPPGAVVVPGSRTLAGGFAKEHGLSVSVALLVKDRDAGTSARVALEGRAPMSLEIAPGPRRGRPTNRNEILRAGRLGGLAPHVLAERFGTPLYVYDLDVIERQVAALQAVLPPVVELAYAVKANPALAVVEHLGRLGLGADVASGGELATARRAGIEPANGSS